LTKDLVGRLILQGFAQEWAYFLYRALYIDAFEAKCSVARLALLGVFKELQADHASKMS
jgi:hypothetical protein